MLSKEAIELDEIQTAQNLLNEFCNKFQQFYGISAITINIHLLRHYGEMVRKTGPLWCNSLFGFESNMGVLTDYYNGGANLLEQIASKYVISRSVGDSEPIDRIPKCTINLFTTSQHDDLIKHALEFSRHETIKKTTHVKVGKELFKSTSSKPTKSIDHFFRMIDGSVGAVIFYVVKGTKIFLLLNVYLEVKKKFHLIEVEASTRFTVLPFESIKEKILFLTFGTYNVITTEPNKHEKR